MRSILTGWLIQVHSRFRAPPEILSLCINIIGPFLSTHVVSLVKLQPVGITRMFIAVKVKEIISPSARNLLYCVDDSSCSEIEILQAECYVLETLGWNLSYPNPIHFCSRADSSYSETETLRAECCVANALAWNPSYPNPIHFLPCADSSYSETEILQAERYILETLGWNLSYPNPIHFRSRADPSYSETESSRPGVATSTHWVGTSAISIPPTSSTVLTPLTPNSRLSVASSTR